MPLLMDVLLELNRLQFENDSGAHNALLPVQERMFALMNGCNLSRGLIRRRIECHPGVAPLRNRLDDWGNYGDAKTQRSLRAARMLGDVIRLMDRRNSAAKALEFADYPCAALTADGLDISTLEKLLDEYLSLHLESAASSARSLGLDMENWYAKLIEHGRLEAVDEPLPLLNNFAELTGMGSVLAHCMICTGDGCCCASQTGRSVFHMHIAPVDSIYGWRTLFHEFGHLCVYASLPNGRLPWLSCAVDELLAVLFENAAVLLLAEDPLRTRMQSELSLGYTRAAVSAKFELALWKYPAAADALYMEHFGALVDNPAPGIWAADSFRSTDCMTIYAYALGQLLAGRTDTKRLLKALPTLCRSAADIGISDIIQTLD